MDVVLLAAKPMRMRVSLSVLSAEKALVRMEWDRVKETKKRIVIWVILFIVRSWQLRRSKADYSYNTILCPHPSDFYSGQIWLPKRSGGWRKALRGNDLTRNIS